MQPKSGHMLVKCPDAIFDFNANPPARMKFRFIATEALGNVLIGTANLLNLLKMTQTSSTAEPIFSAVRLHKVTIWGAIASDLVPVDASIEFSQGSGATSNIGNPPRVFCATSSGTNHPANISVKPDPNSAAGAWQSRGNTTAITNGAVFYLNASINSTIDIDMEVILQNREVPQVSLPVVAAPVGQLLCGALDNGLFIQPRDNTWPYFG